MGPCMSQLKKEKTNLSNTTSNIHENRNPRYPLPLETQMLRNIKKLYNRSPELASQTKNKEVQGEEEATDVNNNPLHTLCVCRGSERKELMVPLQRLMRGECDYESDTNCGRKIGVIKPRRIVKSVEDKDDPKSIPRRISTDTVYVAESEGSGSCEDDSSNEKCRSNTQLVEEPINITELPVLVVENLVKHLSRLSILALRATCKTTKSWIDCNMHILADFKLRIDPESCEFHSPPETAPWSNMAFPYISLHSGFIQDIILNYGEIIWSLEIYAPRTFNNSIAANYPCQDSHRLFEIINSCSKLQNLIICRIDSLTNIGESQLHNLCVLSIDRIQWMKHSDFDMFETLIMKCPNLEYIKIPEFEILGSLAFIFYDSNTQPEIMHLVLPLMRYLDLYKRNNSYSTKLYIDVVEFEDFKLCSSEAFYQLSRKCAECNAVLMNVYFVPRDAVLRNQQDIVESFASMFGFIKIDFRAELWKNLEVMECWIEDFPDDTELTFRQMDFLKTIPKIRTLKCLTIRLSVDNPDVCNAALQACVGLEYKEVRKLILRRHHTGNPDVAVKIPEGFGNAFANIRHLYLQEIDSRNEDFKSLWASLSNLEELFIYKCPYLTQEAFLSEDNPPPILSLKKLQVMVIFLFDDVDGFDDTFLHTALRYMKLKGFALRGVAGVKFTETGMFSLLDSPFHDTIEDFEAPSTLFRPSLCSSYWKFYVALPKKELRQNRIWLSCSILMNSLSSRKHRYDFKRRALGI